MSLVTRTLAVASLGLAALFAGGSQAKAGDYCREYTRTVYVGGIQQQAYGTACLEPDGAWRIADESLNNRYDDGYADGGYVQNASNVTYIIHDGPRVIHQPRIRYVRHYVAPRPVYYSPGIRITYYNRDRHDRWDRHDRRDNRWDRHDRWNRHDRGRHNGWRDRD